MNRQNFLFNAAMASGGAVLTFGGFMRRAEAFRETKNLAAFRAAGFGELVPAATQNTGETYLTLPNNFQYKVIGEVEGTTDLHRFTQINADEKQITSK
jgi:hypothetical protein